MIKNLINLHAFLICNTLKMEIRCFQRRITQQILWSCTLGLYKELFELRKCKLVTSLRPEWSWGQLRQYLDLHSTALNCGLENLLTCIILHCTAWHCLTLNCNALSQSSLSILSFLTMEYWNQTLQYFLGARGKLPSILPKEYMDQFSMILVG